MSFDVAGLGNALVDALVVIDDDAILGELGLTRGTMHPVDDAAWQKTYEQFSERDVTLASGGSCANTIATIGRLGGKAIYCGQTGQDDLGNVYVDKMNEACGDNGIVIAEGLATGKCLSIISASDAERTMLTDLGASTQLPDVGPFKDHIRGAKVAHFTGYTLLGGPIKDATIDAMQAAKAAGTKVSLDVADPFVVHALKDLMWEVIDEYVDIVFLNAEEARALTDVPPQEAAEVVRERARVEVVVVKLGSQGSIVVEDGSLHPVAIEKVDAIDTTGAGDAYAGGFLYGYVAGWGLGRAGALGSAVAALTVAQVGAVVDDHAKLSAVLERIAP